MKLLVTGAAGFIGSHLVRLLRQKVFQVRALVRNGSEVSGLRTMGTETAAGDVRDLSSVTDALKGCRRLYHLAADYRIWVDDPKTMYILGSTNILLKDFFGSLARKYMHFDCSKAVRELRLPQNPVERALGKAVEWFRNNGYIKSFHEVLNV